MFFLDGGLSAVAVVILIPILIDGVRYMVNGTVGISLQAFANLLGVGGGGDNTPAGPGSAEYEFGLFGEYPNGDRSVQEARLKKLLEDMNIRRQITAIASAECTKRSGVPSIAIWDGNSFVCYSWGSIDSYLNTGIDPSPIALCSEGMIPLGVDASGKTICFDPRTHSAYRMDSPGVPVPITACMDGEIIIATGKSGKQYRVCATCPPPSEIVGVTALLEPICQNPITGQTVITQPSNITPIHPEDPVPPDDVNKKKFFAGSIRDCVLLMMTKYNLTWAQAVEMCLKIKRASAPNFFQPVSPNAPPPESCVARLVGMGHSIQAAEIICALYYFTDPTPDIIRIVEGDQVPPKVPDCLVRLLAKGIPLNVALTLCQKYYSTDPSPEFRRLVEDPVPPVGGGSPPSGPSGSGGSYSFGPDLLNGEFDPRLPPAPPLPNVNVGGVPVKMGQLWVLPDGRVCPSGTYIHRDLYGNYSCRPLGSTSSSSATASSKNNVITCPEGYAIVARGDGTVDCVPSDIRQRDGITTSR